MTSKFREYFSRNPSRRYFTVGTCFMSLTKVHNEILSITLHEYCLLTIYRTVFVILHPSRDLRVSSASSLNSSINCLEQCQDMPLRNRIEPPIRRRNDWLIIFKMKVIIQERLLCFSLVDIIAVVCSCYCCHQSDFRRLQCRRICIIISVRLLMMAADPLSV